MDCARLRGTRPRGVSAQCHRPPRRPAGRRGRGLAAADAGRRRRGASADRPARPPEPSRGRDALPRRHLRPPPGLRQRLYRGGRNRWEPPRAVLAAPRSDAGDRRIRWLAGGLRLRRRRPSHPLRAGGCGAADPAPNAVQPARRPLRPLADGGGGRAARHPQRRRRLEQGTARQRRTPVRRPGLRAEHRRGLERHAVHPPQGGAGGELSGQRQCRPPASPRRRPRLAPALAVAEGDGLRRGQGRRRPRDRPGLRRAAAAARASGRQHPRELRRGQPRLLPPDGHPAGAPHRRLPRPLAGAGLRPRAA